MKGALHRSLAVQVIMVWWSGLCCLTAQIARPANDNFDQRQRINAVQTRVSGTTAGATLEFGEMGYSGYRATVWYAWKAPVDGSLYIRRNPTLPLPWIEVAEGETLPVLQPVEDGYGWGAYFVREGREYVIRVGEFLGGAGSFEFDIDFSAMHVISPVARSVVSSRQLTLDISPAQVDLDGEILAVNFNYGTDGGRLGSWGSRSRPPYRLHLSNVAPGRYILYPLATNSAGRVRILNAVDFIVRPANDDFAHRIPLIGHKVGVYGATDYATHEPGEPAGAGEVWYSWVAHVNGSILLQSFADPGTAILALFAGSTLDALQPVGAGAGILQAHVTAGTAYQISVSVHRGVGGGPGYVPSGFHLDFLFTPDEAIVPPLVIVSPKEVSGYLKIDILGAPKQVVRVERSKDLIFWRQFPADGQLVQLVTSSESVWMPVDTNSSTTFVRVSSVPRE